MSEQNKWPWHQSYTGAAIDFGAVMRGEEIPIRVEDICHQTSMQCRYNGAVTRFYSVAEHLVLCWRMARALRFPIRARRWALLHDAHETYTGDLISPLKRCPGVREAVKPLEDAFDRQLYRRFGVYPDKRDLAIVHDVDLFALAIEKPILLRAGEREWDKLPELPDVLADFDVQGLTPYRAKNELRNAMTSEGLV